MWLLMGLFYYDNIHFTFLSPGCINFGPISLTTSTTEDNVWNNLTNVSRISPDTHTHKYKHQHTKEYKKERILKVNDKVVVFIQHCYFLCLLISVNVLKCFHVSVMTNTLSLVVLIVLYIVRCYYSTLSPTHWSISIFFSFVLQYVVYFCFSALTLKKQE